MRPIEPLVRLPHSHIDPNWLSTVERASLWTPSRPLPPIAIGTINTCGLSDVVVSAALASFITNSE